MEMTGDGRFRAKLSHFTDGDRHECECAHTFADTKGPHFVHPASVYWRYLAEEIRDSALYPTESGWIRCEALCK